MIQPINIGSAPNDGTGQDLRSGGQIINDNFAELDTRTAAAQAQADQGVADAATAKSAADAARAKADAAVPSAALGVSVAQLVNGTVPAGQLPSYVDDVLEYLTVAEFPATGETGKIYIAINGGDSPTNPTRQYRWSGTAFVLIPASPGSTDQVPEGTTNLYFTAARVRSALLTGLGAFVDAAISATDSLMGALAKLQGQINGKLSLSGGSLTGPLSSSSTGQFLGITLSSTSDTLIMGGAPHTAVGLGPVVSIAKNDNMVSEYISYTSNGGFCPRVNLLRAQGTAAAPAAVVDTNLVGALQFVAYGGTSFGPTASITGVVDGTPGTAVPGAIQFNTNHQGGAGNVLRWQIRSAGHFLPGSDNAYTVGAAGARPSVLWAATGTISTSDAREKTPVRALDANELAAAAALVKEIGAYKWLASVACKGGEARDHIGMTVQRAIEIMESHGLEPFSYGFICFDEWGESPEVIDEGVVVSEARAGGSRYSFRTDQLSLFLAAGLEARISALEKAAQ